MAIDTSKPSIGRIYDFMLGGHHNFEVDRRAARGMLKVFPAYPRWARINRWFLQYVAGQWTEQGRTRVLDVASGLPTQGHFNETLPAARILFTDNDPLSVAYGDDLLKDQPNMAYREGDVREPGRLLARAAEYFAADRRLAIGAIGILYFLEDEEVAALLRALHGFAAPGSVLAVSFLARIEGASGERFDMMNATMRRLAGIGVVPRSPERLAELAAPWKLVRQDSLPRLLEVPDMFEAEEFNADGAYLGGGFFEH